MSSLPGGRAGWNVLESDVLYDSPHLQLRRERIATPTRPAGVTWMVVHRREAAVVAPRTPDGRFLLIRQERAAVLRETWEFPAGQVDGAVSETVIRETARRELGEETGFATGEDLVGLGSFYSSVGFTDEHVHLFLARGVVPRADGADHDEHEAILEVRAFFPAELHGMVGEGTIVDSNTLATYARLVARGLLEAP